MLMREALAEQKALGINKTYVMLIRRNMRNTNASLLTQFLDISGDKCERVIELIQEHPDWDDEQIAEEICWDD